MQGQQKLWNRDYILVCLGGIFIFSNFYMLLSAMPLALQSEMGIGAKQMSWIVSIYSLGVVLLRPFSGLLADRIGKKRMTFLGFLLFILCTIAYFGVGSIGVLLTVRFVHGILHSLSTTSHAAMAVDFSPRHMLGQGIGYYGMAMCVAMVVAPALGLYVLENYDYQALLVLSAVMALVGTLLTLLIKRDVARTVEAGRKSIRISEFIEWKAIPMSIGGFFISFCYSGILAFIAVYLQQKQIDGGAIYFYLVFALSTVVARPLVGKFIDQRGAGYLIYPSLILFGAGMVILALSQVLWMVLLSGFILGASYGSLFPSFQTMAVKACSAKRTAGAMATFFLFYDLGFGIGALMLAEIAAGSNYETMYLFISLIVLLTILLYALGNALQERRVEKVKNVK